MLKKYFIATVLGAVVSLPGIVLADVMETRPMSMGSAPTISSGPTPQFRFDDVAPRGPATGLYAGAFGGASLSQVSGGDAIDLNPLFPGAGLPAFGYNMGDSIQPLAGVKFGYTWDMSNVPGYMDNPAAPKFLPTVEFEAFYMGFKGSGAVTGPAGILAPGANATTKFDSAIFSLNGILKYDLGIFRPYVGAGVGGGYLITDSSRLTVSPPGGPQTVLRGSADDWVLTAQGLAGLELMVAEQWGLFAEYKFLVMVDPEFRYNNRYTESFDYIGSHIVSGGFRYYFK